MKKLFMLVAVLAVSGVVFSSWGPDCPTQTGWAPIYLPNPDDCSTFYECSNGEAVLQECPEGLLYCSELQLCAWDWDFSCSFDCTSGDGDTGGGGNTGGGGSVVVDWPCYNGGIGSTQCSIDGGITIAGFGVSAACSVTCGSGYYACCGLRCVCRKS